MLLVKCEIKMAKYQQSCFFVSLWVEIQKLLHQLPAKQAWSVSKLFIINMAKPTQSKNNDVAHSWNMTYPVGKILFSKKHICQVNFSHFLIG